ncbi:IS110 family transposase [Candidatus Poriferisodalis sp.]|uniref:IS110 family transposase n=1 Tax=Candidatus Poriferisodalis sp. TaxID=3101277 RepID=UPI003D10332F
MTVVGIDTHKDTLAACAADNTGRPLEHRSFANTPKGHAELAGWVQHHSATLVAIEGSGNYGRPAATALSDVGAPVVEVPPQMTAVTRRRQRTGAKTDPGDAPGDRPSRSSCALPAPAAARRRHRGAALFGAIPTRTRRRPNPPG